MEQKEKISVVIPVYNGERFIEAAISSVLDQTADVYEIIIVDDCSEDSTFYKIKNIKDRRIKYYRNKRNMERAFSRNIGVRLSKGDFVFFLDYDDMWKREYIEESVEYLKMGYDIVYSIPREFINTEGKIIRVSRKFIPNNLGYIIFNSLIGYPSATGIRKNTFDGYAGEYIPREDWEFFIRSFLLKRKIKILDNMKVMIREHSHRTSKALKFMLSTLKVYEDYKRQIPQQYLPDFTFHTALMCLRFGNLYCGWKLSLSSLIKNPFILKNFRNLINLIKWGFRVDRWIARQFIYKDF